MQTWYQERRPDGTVPHALREIARAPDDIDTYEFALEWGVNPREIREYWELEDMYKLKLIQTAKALAEPEIQRRLADRVEREARLKRKKKR